MPTPLHVLILEDREADARLMVIELREADFEPTWQRVETAEDFLVQLRAEPQVILADYHLPQFNAVTALRLLRERGLDIPFLVVTGALGDEAAVECMRQGAYDFLLKDRLARLGNAVKQALERKRAHDARREAEAALRRAYDDLEEKVRQRTAELEAAKEALAARVRDLEKAAGEIKQLQDLLPICAWCKKIRDDQNYWHQVEVYVGKHFEARFSHCICPECFAKEVEKTKKINGPVS